MEQIGILITAGRAAVEFTLFIVLPVMVVMLSIMRLLEACGTLDWMARKLAPIVEPFGLNSLGVFAALQVNFISSTAPVATLATMERRGVSNRHLSATLAMIFAMPQANATFPMIAMGLQFGTTIAFSLVGGLVAASATYYVFGRSLSDNEADIDQHMVHPVVENPKSIIDLINRAGWEATKIAIGAIPMLVLSLISVTILRDFGAIGWLTTLISPLLQLVNIDPILVLPTLTKYLAGGTAMMGVMDELRRSGQIQAAIINSSAGFLIHPLDIPGFAVLVAAGQRIGQVWKPAVLGALVGISIRTIGHLIF